MENTLLNKAKFFAQYWGQDLIKDVVEGAAYPVEGSNIQLNIDTSFLQLKPISSISDEDINYISSKVFRNMGFRSDMEIEEIKRVVKSLVEASCKDVPTLISGAVVSFINDYLRSKGYALPWMGVSVEEQIKRGWIVLKKD